MKTSPNVTQAVPFFGVKDIQRSVKFYTGQLGFEKTLQWEPGGRLRWCNLTRGAVNVMLQEFLQHGEHNFVPTERLGVGMSICFMCEDALALFEEFTTKGLVVKEPFVGNSMWVIELTDPDGYTLCFESVTGVEEGTRYFDWKKEQQ